MLLVISIILVFILLTLLDIRRELGKIRKGKA